MTIKINCNGEAVNLETPVTLAEFLKQRFREPERLLVEYNGELKPSDADLPLADGDSIALFSLVAGG